MVTQISELLPRIAGHVQPRVVTPDEFRAITCNRCGACCDDIPMPLAPDELAARAADAATDEEQRRFLAGLSPARQVLGGWRYRCEHFRRDAEGLGVCTIYEFRPAVCRWFPGGNAVRTWSTCAWYVRVDVDRGGVAPLTATGAGDDSQGATPESSGRAG
jgi:Fe-S-cluster containining protein